MAARRVPAGLRYGAVSVQRGASLGGTAAGLCRVTAPRGGLFSSAARFSSCGTAVVSERFLHDSLLLTEGGGTCFSWLSKRKL